MIKDNIIKAYNFSKVAHRGGKRNFSGLSYFSHPKGVARIIEDLTQDEDLIIAAFLHDTIEDTKVTYQQILDQFGEKVANIVQEVTNDPELIKKLSKVIYMEGKVANLSKDALTIKLADRFHNLLYLEGDKVPLAFITKYYKETTRILNVIETKDEIHLILIHKIEAILEFLKIRHNFQ